MAKLSTEELLDAFKELTLIELSEFVKAFVKAFPRCVHGVFCSPPAGLPRPRRPRQRCFARLASLLQGRLQNSDDSIGLEKRCTSRLDLYSRSRKSAIVFGEN